MLAESVPRLCNLNTCTQTRFTSTLIFFILFFWTEPSREWRTAYLQPASCRIQQSGTSGSSCIGAAACPSDLTPGMNWTYFSERNLTPWNDEHILSLVSDLEVFLHGFSDKRDVVRRSHQVVSGIEHRLHRQMGDPECWETDRCLCKEPDPVNKALKHS